MKKYKRISMLMLAILILMILTGCQEKKEVTLTVGELDNISFRYKSNKVYDFYMVNDSDDLEVTKATISVQLINRKEPYIDSCTYKLSKDETIEPHSEEQLDIWHDVSYDSTDSKENTLKERFYTVVKDGCEFNIRINLKDEVTIHKVEE